jgi:drug/metabolite transporter (DMT)-like permease
MQFPPAAAAPGAILAPQLKPPGPFVLGALFAVLSAASFALNNASVRRGVVKGTPLQAMAISVPLGVACFLPLALVMGELARLPQFPRPAVGWMAGLGVLHFVIGRYCNFRANQLAGVNLSAPVVQLQVVVTMVLAVTVLHEPCTLLQMIGGALIIFGSLITQRQSMQRRPDQAADAPAFDPRHAAGYLFASGAALAYGTTPVMARFALEHTGPATGVLGGLISYVAATTVASLALLSPSVRKNVFAMRREDAPWFALSGVMVAAAQGFFFAAVSVAPVMLVMPLLQLSLAFRMLFSTWLNPHHEVVGPLVMAGVATSIAGALMVSIDSSLIVNALAMPSALAHLLLWHV